VNFASLREIQTWFTISYFKINDLLKGTNFLPEIKIPKPTLLSIPSLQLHRQFAMVPFWNNDCSHNFVKIPCFL